jgi:alkanesulfonate monooxygenase SsuD/methylene tetrahydromethanopterin reductase-like flavin-dependent oxidoreductase (luciferase family)
MTRISLTAPQFSDTFQPLARCAAFAEDSGFDGVFLFDHLVPIGDQRRPVLEMAAALGALAASTSRIGVGTLVMRAPMRGAEVSASVATAAAAVAGSRLIVGLGAGDRLSDDEDARYGAGAASFEARLAAVRETAALIRRNAPETPIWVGGLHPWVRELAGEVADGWNGWMIDADRFGAITRALPSRVDATWGGAVVVGRDADDVDSAVRLRGSAEGALVGTVPQIADELRRYVDCGAMHLVLSVLPNRLERWEVAAELRAALA